MRVIGLLLLALISGSVGFLVMISLLMGESATIPEQIIMLSGLVSIAVFIGAAFVCDAISAEGKKRVYETNRLIRAIERLDQSN